ncbi:MAG TPA: extracellular solute-binding protein [Acidimicrobiales bacterium]|nr:extracellular solute-binding protein [Acidimicrobiales bacterium]
MALPRRRTPTAAVLPLATVLLLAGCGARTATSSAKAPAASGTSTASTSAPSGSGPVDVLFAASLQKLLNGTVGPAFDAATGYRFTGTAGDSGALANQIKARTAAADVFISASPSKDEALEGAANGDLVSWYATFATSDLELGYDPASRFAGPLTSSPWYAVLAQPGVLVGRTDPATDPKGALTVTVLDDAATAFHQPALSALATSDSDVFPEAALVGRLQAGQLDAGFFYAVEAASNGIKTVALTGVPTQHATYTITIPADAPHPDAAAAFVRYLLASARATTLRDAGLAPASPAQVTGTPPAGLSTALAGS